MLKKTIESDNKATYVEEDNASALPRHSDPLVSAIITTHNRESVMVRRAVNSVLNQTYNNIELIVVDDSSPDYPERADVENSVRSMADGIIYIKNKTCQGACAARNIGLRHARGYYVGFLDDDDEWMPAKTKEQIKGFRNDDTAMVYGPVINIDDTSNNKYISGTRDESGYIFGSLMKGNYVGSTSNPLIKKECIEAVGGFDEQMESHQDYDLWLRLALKYQVQHIDEPLLRYHIHPGECISADYEKKINGIERILLKYASYYNKDKDARYIWLTTLIPFYEQQFGRKKTLALCCNCVKTCPERVTDHSKRFVRILLGADLYTRLASLYHIVTGDMRE